MAETETQAANDAARLLLRTGVTMTKFSQAEESDQFHDVCFWYDVAQKSLCWKGVGMFKSAKSIPLTDGTFVCTCAERIATCQCFSLVCVGHS
jgi:hypothetical protein